MTLRIQSSMRQHRLARIFGNLVGNAVKYTPKGGKVEVRVTAEGNCATVAVAEKGLGSPEEDPPRLFQEFFRASNARSSEITCTGLGLAIVKRLVTTYGGVVSVRSAVGKRTTFTVTLPRCPGAPSA